MEARTLLSTLSLSASPTSVGESDPYGVQVAFNRTYPVPPGGPHYATFELSGAARFADPDADYTFGGHDTAYGTTVVDGKLRGRIYLTPTGTSTLTIKPLYDVRDEPDEPVVVTATDAPGHTIDPASASVTILDDDPAPATVSVTATGDDAVAHEGGGERGRYTFTRSGGNTGAPLTLRYRVRNPSPPQPGVANDDDYSLPGSAVAGTGEHTGYTLRPISFSGGQTVLTVDLTPFADSRIEGDEAAVAEVISQEATGGIFGTPAVLAGGAAAVITIKDPPGVGSVTWAGVNHSDGATNFDENNPADMGGGFRLFPDKNTPTGPVHDKVKVQVKLDRAVAAGEAVTVYVKLFDVDDPSAFAFPNGDANPVDALDVLGNAQHVNYYKPGDNRGMAPPAAPALMTGQDTISHEYTMPSLRAGDNWRAFASTNQALADAITVDQELQSGRSEVNPFRRGVAPFDVPPKKYASDTLAIWRKLHLEVDAMRPGKLGQNRHDGPLLGVAFNAATGETTFRLPIPADPDFYQNDQFEGGWIQVFGQPTAHAVTRSNLVAGSGEMWVIVDGNQTAGAAVNALTHVYDDDIAYSPTGGFSYEIGPTITDPDTSELAASLKEAFFEPVLDFSTSDALISFERNIDATEFTNAGNADRQVLPSVVNDGFIAAHLVSTFQGPAASDGDPRPGDYVSCLEQESL